MGRRRFAEHESFGIKNTGGKGFGCVIRPRYLPVKKIDRQMLNGKNRLHGVFAKQDSSDGGKSDFALSVEFDCNYIYFKALSACTSMR